MSLAPGVRVGSYEILAKLGEGGMGEVWRAHDAHLGRDVALKVLPEAFTEDAERLARFEREAKLLAQLNHQNIAQIYGLETSGATRALVMELVEGPTLADRLKSGALPLEESLTIARQIAEALEEAHEKGIIHRDLKPANIKASPAGKVKVLDFGLAKAMEPVGASPTSASQLAQSPTLTLGATVQGVILGTAAYMAPEQAKGLAVDKRTDIWAFGVVLYEMVTGKSLFASDSVPDTLARVLQREIDFEALPKSTPPAIRRLLRRCLERQPRGRLHDIADARLVIEDSLGGRGDAVEESRPGGTARFLQLLPWAIAIVAVGALVIQRQPRSRPAPTLRGQFEIPLPEGEHLDAALRRAIAISPDGRTLAMIASASSRFTRAEDAKARRIEVRALDGDGFRPLAGTEGAVELAFSPDGRRLAFTVSREVQRGDKKDCELREVELDRGSPRTITACGCGWGLAWGPGDRLVFAGIVGGIQSVAASGGEVEWLTSLDSKAAEASHRHPVLLSDGRTLIYSATGALPGTSSAYRLFAEDLSSKRRTLLAEGATDPRFVPPDRLFFARDGTIFTARFDVAHSRLVDTPRPIIEGVAHALATGGLDYDSAEAQYDLSESGLIVYGPGSIAPPDQIELLWANGGEKSAPLRIPPGPYAGARLDPGGQRLLLSQVYPGRQVELYDLRRGSLSEVTFGVDPTFAIWGPGPDRITFASTHEGFAALYSQAVDSPGGEIERLTSQPFTFVEPSAWAPDGKTLFFAGVETGGPKMKIWALERGGKERKFFSPATSFGEAYPELSPDGAGLLYASDRSGEWEVWLHPLAQPGPDLQVSVDGGLEPSWSTDAKAIVFRKTDRGDDLTRESSTFYQVTVSERNGEVEIGRPQTLVSGKFATLGPVRGYEIAPDGRLLLKREVELTESERAKQLELLFPKRLRVLVGMFDPVAPGARR